MVAKHVTLILTDIFISIRMEVLMLKNNYLWSLLYVYQWTLHDTPVTLSENRIDKGSATLTGHTQ
jgi:hypothetical protein